MVYSTNSFATTFFVVMLIIGSCDQEEPQPKLNLQTSQVPYFVADAGGDFGILTGDRVNLKAAFAQNQLNNTFNWKFLSMPETSQAKLSDPNLPNTSFKADQQGIYKLELSMSQDKYTVYDTVNVSAFTIVNRTGTYTIPSMGANGEVTKLVVLLHTVLLHLMAANGHL